MNSPVVFADLHHSGLYNSLHLLFEKRLGGTLLRPIGMSWWKEGYWKLNDQEGTAKQYLQVNSTPTDGTRPLNTGFIEDQLYLSNDEHDHFTQKAIDMDAFWEADIDYVIASVPQHIKPYQELAAKKGAKFIFQMGNMFTDVIKNLHEIPNLMASTVPFPVPDTCNAVFYHQEFNTQIFSPTTMKPNKLISSFINVYHENPGFEDYMMLRAEMPDYEFRSFGGQCENGSIVGVEKMAAIMRLSQFGFHVKRGGDGFGHVLYNWFASGKPVITRMSDYKGKLGEELLIPGETCFDLDSCNIHELSAILNTLLPEKYEWMCQRAYQVFSDSVDYDLEEVKIREFLKRLR